MKKLFVSALALTFFAISAHSQQKREMHSGCGGQQKGKMGVMKDLNLTESQKTQMKASHQAFKAKMDELEKNDGITVKEYKQKKAALQKEQKSKMESLLTADQKAKLSASKSEMEAGNSKKVEERMAKMKEKLSLSDEQVTQLKAKHETLKSKMKAIRDNDSLDKSEKKRQMMALREEAKNDAKTILNADQLKKMEEMKKDFKKEKGSKEWKESK